MKDRFQKEEVRMYAMLWSGLIEENSRFAR